MKGWARDQAHVSGTLTSALLSSGKIAVPAIDKRLNIIRRDSFLNALHLNCVTFFQTSWDKRADLISYFTCRNVKQNKKTINKVEETFPDKKVSLQLVQRATGKVRSWLTTQDLLEGFDYVGNWNKGASKFQPSMIFLHLVSVLVPKDHIYDEGFNTRLLTRVDAWTCWCRCILGRSLH